MHAASTTFAVVGESGRRLGSHVVETNGQALVEQLQAIAGTRHVVLAEGTQSGWLYEILSPHAEEIVVAMVSESRGQKSDESDAFHLAEQLRTGALKQRVFKEVATIRPAVPAPRAQARPRSSSKHLPNTSPSPDLPDVWRARSCTGSSPCRGRGFRTALISDGGEGSTGWLLKVADDGGAVTDERAL